MLELLRLLAEIGTAANWVVIFTLAVVAVFVGYLGIAMHATFRASDPEQRKIRYKVFQDLLRIFVRGWRR
jgi:hypothetical protein